MQRLEEIKLELGDKCTLSDGTFDYINIEDLNRFENLGLLLIDCNVIKLERYVQCNDIIDNPTNLYELVTIWERKEILDKEEKEYLGNVIRPFRDEDYKITIEKRKFKSIPIEDLVINFSKMGTFYYPQFEAGTKFKGMEQDKEYTLEELGL